MTDRLDASEWQQELLPGDDVTWWRPMPGGLGNLIPRGAVVERVAGGRVTIRVKAVRTGRVVLRSVRRGLVTKTPRKGGCQ